jgi:hypothetical protein
VPDHIATTSWTSLLGTVRSDLMKLLIKSSQAAQDFHSRSDFLPYLTLSGHLRFSDAILHPLPEQVLNLSRPERVLRQTFFSLLKRMLSGLSSPSKGLLQLQCCLEPAAEPCAMFSVHFEVVSEQSPYRSSQPVRGLMKLERRRRIVAEKHSENIVQGMIEMFGTSSSVIRAAGDLLAGSTPSPPVRAETPSSLERAVTAAARGATGALVDRLSPADSHGDAASPSLRPAHEPVPPAEAVPCEAWIWSRQSTWRGTIEGRDSAVIVQREEGQVHLALIDEAGARPIADMPVSPTRRHRMDEGIQRWVCEQLEELEEPSATHFDAWERPETVGADSNSGEDAGGDAAEVAVRWSEHRPFWISHGQNPLSSSPVALQLSWTPEGYTLSIMWSGRRGAERAHQRPGPSKAPASPGKRVFGWAEQKAEALGLVPTTSAVD